MKLELIEDNSFYVIDITGNKVKVYTKIEKQGQLYFWNVSYFYSSSDDTHAYIPSRSESILKLARMHLNAYTKMMKIGMHLIPNDNY